MTRKYDEKKISLEELSETFQRVYKLCPTLPILAIHWMHVKHPINSIQKDFLASNLAGKFITQSKYSLSYNIVIFIRYFQKIVNRSLRYSRILFRSVLLFKNQSLQLIKLRFRFRHEIKLLKKHKFDVIIKSWYVSPTGVDKDKDFYFGDLQHRLENCGVRALFLYGDASNGSNSSDFFRTNVSVSNLCRLPELCLISPFDLFRMLLMQFSTFLRLCRIWVCTSNKLTREVIALASKECLGSSNTFNGMYFWIGKTASKIWDPQGFITLYEGNSWEKCLRRGIKSASKSCITVGYQHTAIFPYNLTLLKPNPDPLSFCVPEVVACLGEQTKRMLEVSHVRLGSSLINFGSFRFGPTEYSHKSPRQKNKAFLVVPEGTLMESKLLFNYAIQVAISLTDYYFIFRCHPIFSFSQIRPHLDNNMEIIQNIEISDNHNMFDDIARSSILLYRSSSIVLYAILNGLKPFYFCDDHNHHVDPLFELNGWREHVTSVEEMEKVLQRYEGLTELQLSESWRKAADYVSKYIQPVEDTSIDALLKRLLWSST